MSFELKTKKILINIFFLLACLLITACSAQEKNITQKALNEQEGTFISSSDSVHKASNQTDETRVKMAEKVFEAGDDNDAFKPQLLAALSDRGIYLHSKADGVALYVGDTQHDYDWSYMTPRAILPRMQVSDFDFICWLRNRHLRGRTSYC
jgi:hypothetical protein